MKRLATALTLMWALAGTVAQTVQARADVVRNGKEQVEVIIGDPANNEPVMLEGEVQYQFKEIDFHDGTVWTEYRAATHGKGIGLWTGTPFVFNETYTFTSHDPAGMAYRNDMRDFVRLISHGSKPNAQIMQTMSVIRDDAGNYTFDFSWDYDVTGKGS